MDPLSGIAVASSILSVIDILTRSLKSLADLQSRFERADFKVSLLIGQLSTLKAALNQINDLVGTSLAGISQHEQLVIDLATSLDCCEAVTVVLDDRLSGLQRNNGGHLATLSKAHFLWEEKEMTDYQNLLNNQINALNLLLTAMQCRSVFEQSRLLQSKESRHLFSLARDDTSSLLFLRDAESCLTYRSVAPDSVDLIETRFNFDPELFNSKPYRSATRYNMIQAIQSGSAKNPQSPPLASDAARSSQDSVLVETQPYPASEGSIAPGNEQFSRAEQSVRTLSEARSLKDPHEEIEPAPKPPPDRLLPSNTGHARRKPKKSGPSRLFDLQLRFSPRLSRQPDLRPGSSQDMETTPKPPQSLVLGISQSGKSTAMKAMKVVTSGYTEEERLEYRNPILSTTISAWGAVLEAMKETNAYVYENALSAEIFAFRAQTVIDFSEVTKLEDFNVPLEVSSAMETLWAETSVREEFKTLPSDFNTAHFCDAIHRITDPGYIPSEQDILMNLARTTGIHKWEIIIGETVYTFYDVGGIRAKRKKWIHVFDSVSTLLFFVDASSYNGTLVEDRNANQMEENFMLFSSVCKSELVTHTKITLFFHKMDKLERQLVTHPFHFSFRDAPGYSGDPSSLEDVKKYLRDTFVNLHSIARPNGDLTVHYTSITDAEGFGKLVLASAQ